jgi:ketose-bisphosphate aldolase
LKIKEYLINFSKKKIAMPAFNVPGFDAMEGVFKGSYETNYPVIVQISKVMLQRYRPEEIKALFDINKKKYKADCFLHLDHCNDFLILKSCISSGWDMVMYDGSNLPVRENADNTKLIANFAHKNNVAIEGEIGAIGLHSSKIEKISFSISDVEYFAHKSEIDCLAIGFGNVHGQYKKNKNLQWPIYEKAYELTKIPLVLHGSSGLTKDEILRALRAGTSKINISTDLKYEYYKLINKNELKEKVLNSPKFLHDQILELTYELTKKYINIVNKEIK